MTKRQLTKIRKLKQRADALWEELKYLSKEYWSFYEDAFMSGESYNRGRIRELYREEELPF